MIVENILVSINNNASVLKENLSRLEQFKLELHAWQYLADCSNLLIFDIPGNRRIEAAYVVLDYFTSISIALLPELY